MLKPSRLFSAGIGFYVMDGASPGEFITEYSGERITQVEAVSRRNVRGDSSHIRTVHKAFLHIDGLRPSDGFIIGRGGGSCANDPMDYARHNAEFQEYWDPTCKLGVDYNTGVSTMERVFLVATRVILPGGEVYVDYGSTYWALHAAI
jgi:hypothetical protein